jgi:ribosomal-protein-alanine N-acetyltransferase
MVVEVDGVLVGRVSIGRIEWGAECGASVGYWIRESHAGRGIVPAAVAMACEFAFAQGMHRLEIAVRPENTSSLRVAQKLGFREEGMRRRYLFIDGAWRDHQVFALTADEPRNGIAWSTAS